MGWCVYGRRRSPTLKAMRHLQAEQQILDSLRLPLRVGFRPSVVRSWQSEELTLEIPRLRLRMGSGCWPRCGAIPVEFGAWH